MIKVDIESIENEITERLDKGDKVYIESGAINDCITTYSIRKYKTYAWQTHEDREVTFTTTATTFPKHLQFQSYSHIYIEEFEGTLFVHIQ